MHSKPVYYEEPYRRSLDAVVVDIQEKGVILDRTICYPEGGGQSGDCGTIGGCPLLDTIKDDEKTIFHVVENPTFAVGQAVHIELDWEHRYHYMKMHTAQHVASGLLFHTFGIGTVSVHQGQTLLTVETDATAISSQQCYQLEDLVNHSSREGHAVSYEVHTQESAQKIGLRRSIKVEGDGVRLVVIEGVDTVACGGLHVANTTETGLFQYIGQEKIRGHIRLIFTVDKEALQEIRFNRQLVNELGTLFSSPAPDLLDVVIQARDQANADRNELSRAKSHIAALLLEQQIGKAGQTGGIPVVCWEVPPEVDLKDLANEIPSFGHLALCAVKQDGEKTLWLIALQGDAGGLLDFPKQRNELLASISGKGGGRAPLFQGVGEGEAGKLFSTFRRLLDESQG